MGFGCVLKVKFLPVLLMGLNFVCSVLIIYSGWSLALFIRSFYKTLVLDQTVLCVYVATTVLLKKIAVTTATFFKGDDEVLIVNEIILQDTKFCQHVN